MSEKDTYDTTFDRHQLIDHAKAVLKSNVSGIRIAEETGITKSTVYAFRQGRRDIEKAIMDTLLKFERMYQKHLELHDNNLEEKGEK